LPPFPSATSIVIVAKPNWFVAGVIVTVRLLVTPPKAIPAMGIRFVLDENAVNVSWSTTVSLSPIENVRGPRVLFTLVSRFGKGEIVGKSFTAVTRNWKVWLDSKPVASRIVTVIALTPF
jgi:hypothetical protein